MAAPRDGGPTACVPLPERASMNERCRGGIEGPTRPDQTERAHRKCGWNGLALTYLREEMPTRHRARRMRGRPSERMLAERGRGRNARSRPQPRTLVRAEAKRVPVARGRRGPLPLLGRVSGTMPTRCALPEAALFMNRTAASASGYAHWIGAIASRGPAPGPPEQGWHVSSSRNPSWARDACGHIAADSSYAQRRGVIPKRDALLAKIREI